MGSSGSKDIERKEGNIKNEVIISPGGFHSLDESIIRASKSVCKIIIPPKEMSSGFLIQLFKDEKEFYCLMTNEHVITKEMIDQKIKIDIYYDSQSKFRKIKLNPNERLIKDFKDIQMDVIIIEIISKDDIPKDYFLLPLIDYMDNYDKLINKEISIIQYPRGEMKYSYGEIKYLTYDPKYQFSHNANTDEGSTGSPIFLKRTTKVVGIHKSGIKLKNIKENFGDFIWPIFTYFKNYSDNNKESKILNKEIKNNNNYYINKQIISNKEFSKNIIEHNEIKNEDKYSYNNSIINNISNNIQNYSDKKINNKKLNKEKITKPNDYNYSGISKVNNISNIDNLNTTTIIYEIYSWLNSIRLFGEEFVKNNINNCYLLIANKEMKLCEYLDLDKEQKEKNELIIKLIEKNKIINMRYMFYNCKSLKKLVDISKWDTKKVTDISYMFSYCESLKELSDISNWDTKNITNMSSIFCYCGSLIELPEISKWETKNVVNMSYMFSCCYLLIEIPDISKWNTENVNNMSFLFCSCKLLKELPKISIWETKNITNMSYMFSGCYSLKELPDISKWNTKNVTNMSYMLSG